MESLKEGVEIRYLPASRRDTEVGALAEPWIADEGPCDAGLRRGLGGQPLRPRGLAFDTRATVIWDEDGVQVLRAGGTGGADPEIVALRSRVLVRDGFGGPPRLFRIDYLRRGALLGSRFTAAEELPEEPHA
jgi:hypothetical protein